MAAKKVEFVHGIWWLKEAGPPCLPEGRDGSCDPWEKKGRKWIYISRRLSGKEKLETIIHEFDHAADPQASEETIEERAAVLAKLLWGMGLRWS